MPESPSVLDFGRVSGRDTKYFLEHGCTVTVTDGSDAICREARYVNKNLIFINIDYDFAY